MQVINNIAYTPEKRNSAIITTIIVLLCLLLFWFFGLSYQVPPPQDPSITINFGMSSDGMGEVQPEISGAPQDVSEEVVEEQVEESQPIEAVTPVEKVMTQETVETVHVPTAEEIAEQKRKEEEAEVKRLQDAAKQRAQQLASAFNRPNGGSEGETGKPGDQGDPNGSKEATSHVGGSGGGNGISHSFSDRNLLSAPQIIDNSQDEGKVVVDIVVDRNGNVIKATPGAIGSTTNSSHLFRKAKDAALKTKFSPNPTAPAEQYGKLTFVFVLE